MTIRLKSLKARLFIGFFVFTSVVLVLAASVLHYEVKALVFASVDKTLHSKLQLINGLLHEEHGAMEMELGEVVYGEYSIPRSGHYYKVLIDGNLLAVSPSLVNADFDLTPGASVAVDNIKRERLYVSTGPAGEPVRVLMNDFMYDGMLVRVFVAESLEYSIDLLEKYRLFLFIFISVAILSGGALIYWMTGKYLRPLETFSSRIETITHKTLSERINAEAETKELARLAVSFNEMMDRLQKAFETEKRIISDASHELKTPVAIISAQCDVYLQRDRTSAEYREALEIVYSVSKSMTHLINNLLSLARLDSVMLEPEGFKSISLRKCLEDVLQLVQPLAKEKVVAIQLICDERITVLGDKDRLTEAFLNIIENALKYNKKNGTVLIASEIMSKEIVVKIKNTGFGIAVENLSRIFERFYRVDSVSEIDGSGLGLSIAKTIIEGHGGTIRMESDMGYGSTVYISLPFERSK